MGMYDAVTCEYPLPECQDVQTLYFQTNDLDCCLEHYTITRDGELFQDGKKIHFTGSIQIHWNNVTASGPGIYTRDGEDAHFLEYQFLFVDGRVTRVELLCNEKKPAAKYKLRVFTKLSQAERDAIDSAQSQKLIGKTMWLWWGGSQWREEHKEGYPVTVVAEDDKEWVVQGPTGFEKINRWQLGSTFFESHEEGKKYKDERKREWEQQEAEFKNEISNRNV